MSMEALAWAMKQPVSPPTRKFVLQTLADKANAAGECWPSLAAICGAVGLKERMVRYHIKALTAGGYMSTENRGRLSTMFRLNLTGNAVPVKQPLSGNGLPDNDCNQLPVNESDKRQSIAPETAALSGNPLQFNRQSIAAANLINPKEPKDPPLRERRVRVDVRASEDKPEWFQILCSIPPGKLSDGRNRNGVDPNDAELIAWAEGKNIGHDALLEVALHLQEEWDGYHRSRKHTSIRNSFQKLAVRELKRGPSNVRPFQRPSTGRVTPPRDDELTVAWNQ